VFVMSFSLPECLQWSIEDVEQWITDLGFPQYKNCLKENFINGRKLILLNASNLPKIGIHDFEDILKITGSVKELLQLDSPKWDISIADNRVKPQTAFVEQKSRTGKKIDSFTVCQFDKNGFQYFLEQEEL